jgi:hypothetical protein
MMQVAESHFDGTTVLETRAIGMYAKVEISGHWNLGNTRTNQLFDNRHPLALAEFAKTRSGAIVIKFSQLAANTECRKVTQQAEAPEILAFSFACRMIPLQEDSDGTTRHDEGQVRANQRNCLDRQNGAKCRWSLGCCKEFTCMKTSLR